MYRWSRARTTLVVVSFAAAGSGIWWGVSDAGQPPTPHDRQQLAAAMLDHWTRSPRTTTGLRALRERADLPVRDDADAVASGSARTPEASGGVNRSPRAFTNVRVNDPSLDSHQVDQTTQNETSI